MPDRPRPFRYLLRRVTPRFHGDVSPVFLGLLVTLAFTALTHFAAQLFPTEALRMWLFDQTGTYYEFDNPFATVQFLGGLVGGGVAGYRTRSAWIDGGMNGLFAAVLGVASAYAIWVSVRTVKAVFDWQMIPPPPVEVFVYPLVVLFPFFVISLLTGFVGGVVGYIAR